jgi:hypothetical protein
MDELIGRDDLQEPSPVATLAAATEPGAVSGHVFTLHAEIEGGRLRGAFEQLLSAWRAQGYELGTLERSFLALDPAAAPECGAGYGTVPGRSGRLAVQGENAA